MKNIFRIIIIFFIIIFNLNNINFAETNNISEICIDINIKPDGSAQITETWKADIYSGTELYHYFEKLYKKDIKNFSVSEDGKKFEIIDKWDISQNQEYKTNKAGISEFSDGIELCFGVGNYGYHEYKLNYTINNFFYNENEINFKILNFKTPIPEKVIVKVNGNFDKNAFAKLKNCNGSVEVKSKQAKYIIENLKENEDITIYLNFLGQDNSIQNNNIIKLQENSDYNILKLIKFSIYFFIIMLIIILLMIIYINSRKVEKLQFKPF